MNKSKGSRTKRNAERKCLTLKYLFAQKEEHKIIYNQEE